MSTFLAATTFYLLTTPEPYRKLQEEIRSRFKSIDDIDATSAQQLPYLQAVISEGLRIYPPGSQGFPRISPGVMVDGIWVPEGVSLRKKSAHLLSLFHKSPLFPFYITRTPKPSNETEKPKTNHILSPCVPYIVRNLHQRLVRNARSKILPRANAVHPRTLARPRVYGCQRSEPAFLARSEDLPG